ncbi:hypothetical protein D1872_346770 [compost metagenome]
MVLKRHMSDQQIEFTLGLEQLKALPCMMVAGDIQKLRLGIQVNLPNIMQECTYG